MTLTPELLGITTAFCWGTSDFLSRRQSQRVGHYNTVVYMHITTLIMLLVVFPFLSPTFSTTPLSLLVLTFTGALNFLAFIYLYRAFHTGVISVVAPVAYTYPVVTTILSVALLGVALSPLRGFCIALIIAGVALLSTRFSELRSYAGKAPRGVLTSGLGSAIASSVLFGMVYVGVGYAAPIVGFVLPAVMLRAVGSLLGLVAAPVMHEDVHPTKASFSKTIMAMGALEAAGFLAFNRGLSLGANSIPIVAALSGMGGAIAASYALVLLKERLEKNQFVGVVLAVIGVFVLLYLEA